METPPKRRRLTEADNIYLITQVQQVCPLCGDALFYYKNGKTHKHYEVAHIYPLNPTAVQSSLLADEERLGTSVNDLDNLIPLCPSCHTKFDKPRTVEEYRQLLQLKKSCIQRSQQQGIQQQYQLASEVAKIIDGLYAHVATAEETEITFDTKEVDEKLDDSVSRLTRQKIKHNVADYFLFVQQKFSTIENEDPNTATLISVQVRSYYLAQKALGLSQQEIFFNIVDWFATKFRPKTIEAAEIVASFFVQNCEVFE